MTSPAARRLPGLDGLRAVAVGIVMVAHGNSSLPMRGAWTRDFWLFFDNGPLGVMIFFVLSGFLITYLLKQEINRTGKIHLGLFYQRRVLRIFPAFYFFLGCVFVLNLLGWLKIKWADFIFAGTFTWNYRIFGHGWNPGHFDNTYDPWAWYLWHTWTLSLEEQFYLLWPAALLLLGLKRGAVAALGILLLEPVLRLAAYLWLPSLRTVSPGMLPFALDPLMAGSLAALWSGEPWFESMVNRVLKKSWLVAGAILFRVFISPILILKFRGGLPTFAGPDPGVARHPDRDALASAPGEDMAGPSFQFRADGEDGDSLLQPLPLAGAFPGDASCRGVDRPIFPVELYLLPGRGPVFLSPD